MLRRPPRVSLATMISVAALGLAPRIAGADSAGLFGYAGNAGMDCGQCHTGGQALTNAFFTGPASMQSGATQKFGFAVLGGGAQLYSGIGLHADEGSLGVIQSFITPTRLDRGELVQSSTVGPWQQIIYDFYFTAPVVYGAPRTVVLSGCGVSADGDRTANGDVCHCDHRALIIQPAPPDMTVPPDLAPPPPDLRPPPDLARPDMAQPRDLSLSPDLLIPRDLSTVPDLAMPDLAMADLTTLDLAGTEPSMPDLAAPDLGTVEADLGTCPACTTDDLSRQPELAGGGSCRTGGGGGDVAPIGLALLALSLPVVVGRRSRRSRRGSRSA